MPFYDQEIFDLISLEKKRQLHCLSLIASENIVSQEVRQAVGSELTNKYAEGYPGKRYYGGCDIHDQIESLAIVRAQKLFSAEHVNVQPHSGSNANMAALFTLAQHGDSILAMDLNHGGHLTHGSRVNFSGKWFNIVGYGVRRDDQHIDYEMVQKLAFEHKPKVIIAGASAYSRTIDFERFRSIADEVGAAFLVDMAHIAGLIATGLHPSPFPHADIVTTTTHKTLRGPRGGMILCKESYAKKVNSWVFPGLQGGPLMHEIAGKAVCFKEALLPSFADYQKQVVANCQRLAEIFLSAGIKLVSGGTDNHLLLLDVTSLGLNGQEAEAALDEIGIVANKNKIPFDEKPATITSGLRLGTASITTRGMGLREIDEIGQIILDRLRNNANSKLLKDKVEKLASKFVA
ncbi:MAG: serine hydroxymethyltransferase [Myxococcales bacterium]|nr:serine hydroxymethyltransferase [Myxococcales bacterium]USN50679.1 MAG: serine hydroxymethyltransferase [Myxococcales bacterium]